MFQVNKADSAVLLLKEIVEYDYAMQIIWVNYHCTVHMQFMQTILLWSNYVIEKFEWLVRVLLDNSYSVC